MTVYKQELVSLQFPSLLSLITITHPGCDMAGRLREPRRSAAATGPVDGAACGATVRGRFVFLWGDGAVGWTGASAGRSWRDEALRFRDEAEPGGSGVSGSAGGGSVASLAEERVILDDMRKRSSFIDYG